MGKGEADAKYFFRKYLLLRIRCYSGTMSLIICICILRQLVGIKLRERIEVFWKNARLILDLHYEESYMKETHTNLAHIQVQNESHKFQGQNPLRHCLCRDESQILGMRMCSASSKAGEKAKNILGTELQSCCTEPMTGF